MEMSYKLVVEGIIVIIVAILGIIANILVMMVLRKPHMRSSINFIMGGNYFEKAILIMWLRVKVCFCS